jgi:CopG family transcriptional regulator/antitoxin EndoAI
MVNKVMVSFPEGFLAEVDAIAQIEHRSRSELLREAMRLYIEMRHGKVRPRDNPQVQKAVAMQNTISHLSPGKGEDSTADIRLWRDTQGSSGENS